MRAGDRGAVSLFILGLINSAPCCHQSSNHTADGTDLIGERYRAEYQGTKPL